MINRNIRNYEVSIWTLQDSFITVLKFPDIESKYQIQDPQMTLKIDGTQEFSFTIPMYIYENNEKKENPNWYNVRNGNLLASMRKIKVIVNKGAEDEGVFEFIITKVEEKHDAEELYCDVSCEGLAFHELGKIGYKISLSSDDFYEEDLNWFNDGVGEEPHATLQYWNDKIFTNNESWTYEIRMDWSNFSGAFTRATNKVYEEEYVSSWSSNLDATAIESYKEKERLVDLEESNIYNLTQNLAETFGVFCKYEYEYDDNYVIVGRKVIYYNNYFNENYGKIDLTYPYSTSSISREMDSTDLVTKMYVKSVSDEASVTGLISILDVPANKTGEDYILNFDYLYEIGSISEEQYAAIGEYEKQIKTINENLAPIEAEILNLQEQVPELEATVTVSQNAIQADIQQITKADNLLNQLTGGTGILEVTAARPDTAVLLKQEENNYYITISQKGVLPATVHIYKNYTFGAGSTPLSTEILTGKFEYDEYGNLSKISNLYSTDDEKHTVYLIYQYRPSLHYERVKTTWTARLAIDEQNLARAQSELATINARLETLYQNQVSYIRQKQQANADFETLMGAALREGYWQPDDYKDYGEKHNETLTIGAANPNYNLAKFIWSDSYFKDEFVPYYELSVTQNKIYYPCIELNETQLQYIINKAAAGDLSRVGLFYVDAARTIFANGAIDVTNLREARSLNLLSQCQLGFIKSGSTIKKVLFVTDVKSFSETDFTNLRNSTIELGIMTTTLNTAANKIDVTISDRCTSQIKNQFLTAPYTIVYPRIEIESLNLDTDDEQMSIKYNDNVLTKYSDYYILFKEDRYYITLKPEAIFSYGSSAKNFNTANQVIKLYYSLSNASTAIYLDSLQVLKENAYPKVSYSISVDSLRKDFVRADYNKLGYLVQINDNDLKFDNVFGYISELSIMLDSPMDDKVTIKNYKTKFEDLFSSIVASTEAMKKNEYVMSMASQMLGSNGLIDSDTLRNSMSRVDLNYAFNNGKLTISEKDGIWGTSDSGVVAFRGGGIFTATDKDIADNWIWNTGITPEGINADLITAGQLDTNKIRIFSGDNLRMQMNGDGLFAYKSFLEDQEIIEANFTNAAKTKLNTKIANDGDMDVAQYVRFWENGLYLAAKNGAQLLNPAKTDYFTLNKTGIDEIRRVEISWDGLILRNWNNEKTFWADPDTGNLNIKGNIEATGLKIVSGGSSQNIDSYISSTTSSSISSAVTDLESQINTAKTNLEGQIGNTNTTVTQLSQSFTALDGKVTSNIEKITAAEGSITALGSRVTQTENEITTAVNDAKSGLQSQINQIPGQITSAVNDAKSNLQSQIDLIPGQITTAVNATAGGINLLKNSGETISNGNYLTAVYDLGDWIENGEKVTLRIWGEQSGSKTYFYAYNSDGVHPLAEVRKATDGAYYATFDWYYATDTTNNQLWVYSFPSEVSGWATIRKIKLERGSKATGWTPSPLDPASEVKIGSEISLTADEIKLASPKVIIDVSGTAGDVKINENGLIVSNISSPSVHARYNGPNEIFIVGPGSNNYNDMYFATLKDAFIKLSGKFFAHPLVIYILQDYIEQGTEASDMEDANLVDGSCMLEHTSGAAITITGWDLTTSTTVNRTINKARYLLYNVQNYLQIQVLSFVNSDSALIFDIRNCPFVYLLSCNTTGNYLNVCSRYNSRVMVNGGTHTCGSSSGVFYTSFLGELLTWYAVVNAGTVWCNQEIGGSHRTAGCSVTITGSLPGYYNDISSTFTGTATVTPGSSAPSAPTTITEYSKTVTASASASKINGSSWQSASAATLQVGKNGGTVFQSIIWFNASDFSGVSTNAAKYTSAKIRLYRTADDGGYKAYTSVRIASVKTTTTNSPSGSASVIHSYNGTELGLGRNKYNGVQIPPQIIVDLTSGAANAVMIYTYNDADRKSDTSKSENYTTIASAVSGNKPQLQFAYTT